MKYYVLPAALAFLGLASCSSESSSQESSGPRAFTPSTSSPGPSEGSGVSSDGTGAPSTGGGGTQPAAGLLTAGTWDDNLNFDFYLAYVDKHAALPGALAIKRSDRLRVDVRDGAGLAVGGARVVVRAGDKTVFDGPSGTDGHVDVYPTWAGVAPGTSLAIEATSGTIKQTASALAGDKTVSLALSGVSATLPTALDVVLVIDTTGSMGDEITFLRTEVAAIANSVAERWPSVGQRWAVVAYKDIGDSYVVKSTPFASDMATIQSSINGLSADGGGDYPEAPDQALAAASGLSWRDGNAARMVFWVADAPHHPGKEGTIESAITTMRGKGVHVYPIAASGTDELAELTMRSTAQLTAGRYLFLTDDSGIGGTHKEPTLPCYFVTKLDNAMRRVIATELTGTYVPPTSAEIIRTGGDPKDGRCTLSDGQQVAIF